MSIGEPIEREVTQEQEAAWNWQGAVQRLESARKAHQATLKDLAEAEAQETRAWEHLSKLRQGHIAE